MGSMYIQGVSKVISVVRISNDWDTLYVSNSGTENADLLQKSLEMKTVKQKCTLWYQINGNIDYPVVTEQVAKCNKC